MTIPGAIGQLLPVCCVTVAEETVTLDPAFIGGLGPVAYAAFRWPNAARTSQATPVYTGMGDSASSASVTINVPAVGRLIVAYVYAWQDTPSGGRTQPTPQSVTDNRGNAWTIASGTYGGSAWHATPTLNASVLVAYAVAAYSGNTVITVSFVPGGGWNEVFLAASTYSGDGPVSVTARVAGMGQLPFDAYAGDLAAGIQFARPGGTGTANITGFRSPWLCEAVYSNVGTGGSTNCAAYLPTVIAAAYAIVPAPVGPPVAFALRINAAGPDYRDSRANDWLADRYYIGGNEWQFGDAIANTADPFLFQSLRWAQSFSYQIPSVENGNYEITLLMVEDHSWAGVGHRVFSVLVGGLMYDEHVDIYKRAGGAFSALYGVYPARVTAGALTLAFTGIVIDASLSGIQIVKVEKLSLRVNCGGPGYTDPRGNYWQQDRSWYGDTGSWSNDQPITGTDMQPLYQTKRYSVGWMSWMLAAPNGWYDVTLHFAELVDATAPGARVFSFTINGGPADSGSLPPTATGFDVRALAGAPRSAIQRTYRIEITASRVDILFSGTQANGPILNAIEMVEAEAPPAPPGPVAYVLRVNIGGGAQSYGGVDWQAENTAWYAQYGGIQSTTQAIQGTTATMGQALFQSNRIGSGGVIDLRIPVPPNVYRARLHFAEIEAAITAAGQRRFYIRQNGFNPFNLQFSGYTFEADFDIYARAPGRYQVYSVTSPPLRVTASGFQLFLSGLANQPALNALEIIEDVEAFVPIRVNCGGWANAAEGDYPNQPGRDFWADYSYTGGGTYFGSAPVLNHGGLQDIYQSERWGVFTYEFRVPNGTYNVTLKFAEIAFTASNMRRFSVLVNGALAIDNLDVWAAGVAISGNTQFPTAVDRVITVAVTDYRIKIEMVPILENPKLSGIQILAA